MARILALVCQELERRRRAKGYSQATIAELLNTRQSRISAIGRGSVPRDPQILHDYARLLGVDLAILLRQVRAELAHLESLQKTILDTEAALKAGSRL